LSDSGSMALSDSSSSIPDARTERRKRKDSERSATEAFTRQTVKNLVRRALAAGSMTLYGTHLPIESDLFDYDLCEGILREKGWTLDKLIECARCRKASYGERDCKCKCWDCDCECSCTFLVGPEN
jgi:hypothetical protein